MKTPIDPRHRARRETIKALFSFGFGQKKTGTKLAQQVERRLDQIDKLIKKSASQWPIEKINRVDLAILRLAVYELAIAKKEPAKVIIDEAIELAKEYGSQKSPGFVNGVLGDILKKLKVKSEK